jgi:hypothetical protein
MCRLSCQVTVGGETATTWTVSQFGSLVEGWPLPRRGRRILLSGFAANFWELQEPESVDGSAGASRSVSQKSSRKGGSDPLSE